MQDAGDADSGLRRLVYDDEALHHDEIAEAMAGWVQLVAEMADRGSVSEDAQDALEVGAHTA